MVIAFPLQYWKMFDTTSQLLLSIYPYTCDFLCLLAASHSFASKRGKLPVTWCQPFEALPPTEVLLFHQLRVQGVHFELLLPRQGGFALQVAVRHPHWVAWSRQTVVGKTIAQWVLVPVLIAEIIEHLLLLLVSTCKICSRTGMNIPCLWLKRKTLWNQQPNELVRIYIYILYTLYISHLKYPMYMSMYRFIFGPEINHIWRYQAVLHRSCQKLLSPCHLSPIIPRLDPLLSQMEIQLYFKQWEVNSGMFNRNSNIIISSITNINVILKVPVQFPPSSHFQTCQGAIFALAFAFATFTTFAFALLRLIHGGRQHGTYEQVLASFVWPQEKLLQLAVSSANSQSIGYWWVIHG